MEYAFPLNLPVLSNSGDIADPVLPTELEQWFIESGFTECTLQWRQVDDNHPNIVFLDQVLRSFKENTRYDTWVIFEDAKQAALFKLAWGSYEGGHKQI